MISRNSHAVTPSRALLFTSLGGRVVVIAMKGQLCGRIRRTVTTLLEEGAEVTIIALKSNSDFLLGLDYLKLEVELLEPTSLYVWMVNRQRSRTEKEKHRG